MLQSRNILSINYLSTAMLPATQHIEFFHRDHFEYHYHRRKAKGPLAQFIDFFWETDFATLWPQHPNGFSDLLYPDLGYTYLINLGTPFIMRLDHDAFDIKGDGFLPRCKHITCHHAAGNKIFGIKFKVSPVLFEKKVNFSEYKEYIFPLAYLIDRKVVQKIKSAASFTERMHIVSAYYSHIIEQYHGALKPVSIVTQILQQWHQNNNFHLPVEALAAQYNISAKTLQRYFETTTSISSKQALQIVRIRKALKQWIAAPQAFNCGDFGYYDYSHFYKHMQQFLKGHPQANVQSHLSLVESRQANINY